APLLCRSASRSWATLRCVWYASFTAGQRRRRPLRPASTCERVAFPRTLDRRPPRRALFAPGEAWWVLSTSSSRRYRKEVVTRNRSPRATSVPALTLRVPLRDAV